MKINTHNLTLSAALSAAVACLALPVLAQTSQPPPGYAASPAEAPPELTKDQGSYLMGLQFTEQLQQLGITSDVSSEAIARGVQDGLAGKRMSPTDSARFKQFISSTMNASIDRNVATAKEFLARNAKEKGVKTTASGLQYRIVNAGNPKAAAPQPTDQVTVHYRGKLLDGTEFDSSYARKQPATFRVNGVIKGWQEALVLLKPGSRCELWVPPELGYDRSPKPGIPGGSLLAFEIELIDVKTGDPAAP